MKIKLLVVVEELVRDEELVSVDWRRIFIVLFFIFWIVLRKKGSQMIILYMNFTKIVL